MHLLNSAMNVKKLHEHGVSEGTKNVLGPDAIVDG
jgi:hypothetical protein